MRNHHPDAVPDHHRVLYKCRWNCGATDPNRSNIEVHMRQHCWKRKTKKPRRHGKWQGDGNVAVTTDANGLLGTERHCDGSSDGARKVHRKGLGRREAKSTQIHKPKHTQTMGVDVSGPIWGPIAVAVAMTALLLAAFGLWAQRR